MRFEVSDSRIERQRRCQKAFGLYRTLPLTNQKLIRSPRNYRIKRHDARKTWLSTSNTLDLSLSGASIFSRMASTAAQAWADAIQIIEVPWLWFYQVVGRFRHCLFWMKRPCLRYPRWQTGTLKESIRKSLEPPCEDVISTIIPQSPRGATRDRNGC